MDPLDSLDFDKGKGLVVAIAQDAGSGEILMIGDTICRLGAVFSPHSLNLSTPRPDFVPQKATAFFISPEGEYVARHIGPITARDIERFIKANT